MIWMGVKIDETSSGLNLRIISEVIALSDFHLKHNNTVSPLHPTSSVLSVGKPNLFVRCKSNKDSLDTELRQSAM